MRAFLNGSVQVVCATVAFGMGINKSNIRWVVHNNLPALSKATTGEIGRAAATVCRPKPYSSTATVISSRCAASPRTRAALP